MDIDWNYQLQDHQRDNPVVYSTKVKMNDQIAIPTNEQLCQVFGVESFRPGGKRLKTWGRKVDDNGKTILENNPHLIAVKHGTPLHFDPKYPRYSHHLKIRVDPGVFVRGMNKKELALTRGVFYILDARSPHQVIHKHPDNDQWNVSLSIDSSEILHPAKTIMRLLMYGKAVDFVTGDLK
jgi:hypothetical protein